jgi:hypothetical protein
MAVAKDKALIAEIEAAEREIAKGRPLAIEHRALVRMLARLVVRINRLPDGQGDALRAATTLKECIALLPPRGDPPFADLSRLSDAELRELERLTRIAQIAGAGRRARG